MLWVLREYIGPRWDQYIPIYWSGTSIEGLDGTRLEEYQRAMYTRWVRDYHQSKGARV